MFFPLIYFDTKQLNPPGLSDHDNQFFDLISFFLFYSSSSCIAVINNFLFLPNKNDRNMESESFKKQFYKLKKYISFPHSIDNVNKIPLCIIIKKRYLSREKIIRSPGGHQDLPN